MVSTFFPMPRSCCMRYPSVQCIIAILLITDQITVTTRCAGRPISPCWLWPLLWSEPAPLPPDWETTICHQWTLQRGLSSSERIVQEMCWMPSVIDILTWWSLMQDASWCKNSQIERWVVHVDANATGLSVPRLWPTQYISVGDLPWNTHYRGLWWISHYRWLLLVYHQHDILGESC